MSKIDLKGATPESWACVDEGEAATITVGDLSINVMRPYKFDQFLVSVELPNGSTLVCQAYRRAITEASER